MGKIKINKDKVISMIKCPICGEMMQGTECGSGYECLKCGTLCNHRCEVVWKPRTIKGKSLT
jgi:tRNA(Ile2) C34 agmatinyltransferase TiaS